MSNVLLSSAGFYADKTSTFFLNDLKLPSLFLNRNAQYHFLIHFKVTSLKRLPENQASEYDTDRRKVLHEVKWGNESHRKRFSINWPQGLFIGRSGHETQAVTFYYHWDNVIAFIKFETVFIFTIVFKYYTILCNFIYLF